MLVRHLRSRCATRPNGCNLPTYWGNPQSTAQGRRISPFLAHIDERCMRTWPQGNQGLRINGSNPGTESHRFQRKPMRLVALPHQKEARFALKKHRTTTSNDAFGACRHASGRQPPRQGSTRIIQGHINRRGRSDEATTFDYCGSCVRHALRGVRCRIFMERAGRSKRGSCRGACPLRRRAGGSVRGDARCRRRRKA